MGACISQVHRLRGDRNDPVEVLRFEVSVEQQLVAETLVETEQQQLSPPESLEQADEARAIGWIAKSTARRQAMICRANPGRDLLLRCLVLVLMGALLPLLRPRHVGATAPPCGGTPGTCA